MRNILRPLVAAAMLACANLAQANSPDLGYDFSYAIDDGGNSGLVQVFDDGNRTYFQFAKQVPAKLTVFSIENGVKHLASIASKSPYLVVSGTGSSFDIVYGKAHVMVSYTGANRSFKSGVEPAQPAEPAVAPEAKPAAVEKPAPEAKASRGPTVIKEKEETKDNAFPTYTQATLLNVPFHEDSITLSPGVKKSLAKMKFGDYQIYVKGKPSAEGDSTIANSRALAIRDYLVKAKGVDPDDIHAKADDSVKKGQKNGVYLSEIMLVKNTAQDRIRYEDVAKESEHASTDAYTPPAKQQWAINAGETVEDTLKRWAGSANWQVSWEVNGEITLGGSSTFTGDFEFVVDQFMSNIEAQHTSLHHRLYAGNHMLRVWSGSDAHSEK